MHYQRKNIEKMVYDMFLIKLTAKIDFNLLLNFLVIK